MWRGRLRGFTVNRLNHRLVINSCSWGHEPRQEDKMIVQYIPVRKIIINGIVVEFGEGRSSVRLKLGPIYKEENLVFTFESESNIIYQRRDIYKDFDGSRNYFFLGYDKNDILIDIEIHDCQEIKVVEASFNFSHELDEIASQLNNYSDVFTLSDGEYFFQELQLAIVDKEHMGGEGSTLGYFYCASDVTHLE